MYKAEKIQCVSCKKDLYVVLSSMEVLVVTKPNDTIAFRNLDKNFKIKGYDADNIEDFDDYIMVECICNHKNRVFIKNEVK